jgi:hypothetical protein
MVEFDQERAEREKKNFFSLVSLGPRSNSTSIGYSYMCVVNFYSNGVLFNTPLCYLSLLQFFSVKNIDAFEARTLHTGPVTLPADFNNTTVIQPNGLGHLSHFVA